MDEQSFVGYEFLAATVAAPRRIKLGTQGTDMPLVIAMIVLPIVGVWLVYEIVIKLCKASENAYEAEKENKAFAKELKGEDDAK